MLPSFLRVALAATLFTGAAAACGDDSVSASDFASDICTAVGDWMGEIQDAGEAVEADIEDAGSDLGQVKDVIVGFLDDGADATDTMIDEVDDAGVPEGDDGEDIADALTEGFEEVKQAFEDERDAVDQTEADDPQELISQFEETQDRLSGEALEDAFSRLGDFEDSDIAQEFETNESCQSVGE